MLPQRELHLPDRPLRLLDLLDRHLREILRAEHLAGGVAHPVDLRPGFPTRILHSRARTDESFPHAPARGAERRLAKALGVAHQFGQALLARAGPDPVPAERFGKESPLLGPPDEDGVKRGADIGAARHADRLDGTDGLDHLRGTHRHPGCPKEAGEVHDPRHDTDLARGIPPGGPGR